eukprot:CAMPEP_0119380100 /NCGR_PEP_ID=MMETSP1334-20130426/55525_1 /TAXON_ID=127549 /ORGANISM="Calcidiscus leptoporus, Strain RCC1130" /LENGTH=35 /DNA_ID= /DNA_START= /DNA_END= /DNA_ORIENTATION=
MTSLYTARASFAQGAWQVAGAAHLLRVHEQTWASI